MVTEITNSSQQRNLGLPLEIAVIYLEEFGHKLPNMVRNAKQQGRPIGFSLVMASLQYGIGVLFLVLTLMLSTNFKGGVETITFVIVLSMTFMFALITTIAYIFYTEKTPTRDMTRISVYFCMTCDRTFFPLFEALNHKIENSDHKIQDQKFIIDYRLKAPPERVALTIPFIAIVVTFFMTREILQTTYMTYLLAGSLILLVVISIFLIDYGRHHLRNPIIVSSLESYDPDLKKLDIKEYVFSKRWFSIFSVPEGAIKTRKIEDRDIYFAYLARGVTYSFFKTTSITFVTTEGKDLKVTRRPGKKCPFFVGGKK